MINGINSVIRFLPALALCVLASQAEALGEIRFERISMEQGLSQSSIQAIAQCPDGFLWFGTQFGLDRFDGYRFQSFRHDAERPDSLSNSKISDLLLSSSGGLWVATRSGLDLFDPRSGRSERFSLPAEAAERRGGRIRILLEAGDGRVYVEDSHGVLIWRPESRQLSELPFAEPVAESAQSRRSGVLDSSGRFWLLNGAGLWREQPDRAVMELVVELAEAPVYPFYNGLELLPNGWLAVAYDDRLDLIDPDTMNVQRQLGLNRLGFRHERFNSVFLSSDGSLWMALTTRVLQYWPQQDRWVERFFGERIRVDENTRQRVRMIEHANGDIWFTSQYGVARWFAEGEQIQLFRHDPRDSFSIPPSTLGAGYTAFVDEDGSVWIGSRLGGLAVYSAHKHRFAHIADRSPIGAIPFAGLNIVRGIAEQSLDGTEYLWLALDHGGVRRLRRTDDGRYEFVSAFHLLADEDTRLPSDAVQSVVADTQSAMIWVLGREHLVGIDAARNRVEFVLELTKNYPGERLRSLTLSANGNRLWVGGNGGLRALDISADRRTLSPVELGPIWPERSLNLILPLADARLLVGADDGVGLFAPDSPEGTHFIEAAQHFPPGDSRVFGLAEHHESGWWIGTRDHGLARLELIDGEPRFEWFGAEHGLVDHTIYAILAQPDGQLWLSSNNGLMRWNPDTFAIRHFTMPDGIQSLEFNNTVAHVGAQGRFYFGGINGVNAFDPGDVRELYRPPRLHLQSVNVRGSPVDWALGEVPELGLSHDQNDLEVMFVGLKFSDPDRVRYAYRLEGLDGDWIDAGNQRQVRYAGLAPGRYRFYARAGNSDGIWSEDKLLLTAHIQPPPWMTGWAYATYLLVGLGILWLAWRLQLQRRRALEALVERRTAELVEQQTVTRRQARELEKALEARNLFFANVSHEFRTPLTLIQASLDRLQHAGSDADAIASGRRYLRHLLRLVDQLLDLSRLRLQSDTLAEEKPWAVAPMVEATVAAFSSLAEQRGLNLTKQVQPGWTTYCSQAHVEKILLNLLTNAIKFCEYGDDVAVELSGQDETLCLTVRDTGPGISKQEQAQVFERFQRVESAERRGVAGAGIGLALVREAAEALGGRVELQSGPGEGSCFRVFLPASTSFCPTEAGRLLSLDSVTLDQALLDPVATEAPTETGSDENLSSVLVVEDNRDLRAYLRRMLTPRWRVIEARSGEEGLAMARQDPPDLLVSDIMMPGMDGLALLKLLRDDLATSHIPVMLLTARQDQATRLKGLSLSADDFLAKPFDAEELVLRIKRMLDNRERLRRRLQSGAAIARADCPELPDLVDQDVSFLARVREMLNRHLADPDLTVEMLAELVNVERRTLQRKLKAMTGLTPAAFIRHQRLQRAMSLLIETDLTVSDIALDSGFASPQHFNRLFRKHYGRPPEQWRQQRKSQTVKR